MTGPHDPGRSFPSRRSLQASLLLGCSLGLGVNGCEKSERHVPIESRVERLASQSDSPEQANHGSESKPLEPLPSAPLPRAPLPPAPPDIAPQLVACGKRGFSRLSRDGFVAYATHSRRELTRVKIPAALNLVSLAGDSSLLVAKNAVYRHYHGQSKARRFQRIPLLGPLQLWPDARNIDAFWVRYLRDPELHHYVLPTSGTASGTISSPTSGPNAVSGDWQPILGETLPLPDFDRRLFTLLDDGTAFYTTPDGLRRAGSTSRRSPLPAFERPLVALWPGGSIWRYWAADEGGEAWWLEQSRGEPRLARLTLAGLPHAASVRGVLLAVVSKRGVVGERRFWLEVFVEGKRVFARELPPVEGASPELELDNHDVCSIDGKPWVLVGGRDRAFLFDYMRDEQLAAWGD